MGDPAVPTNLSIPRIRGGWKLADPFCNELAKLVQAQQYKHRHSELLKLPAKSCEGDDSLTGRARVPCLNIQ